MVKFTPIQKIILALLEQRRGQLVSRDTLICSIWPEAVTIDNGLQNCLNAHVCYLRKKIVGIRTVKSMGYMLE